MDKQTSWMPTTLGQVAEINPPKPKVADLAEDTPTLFVPMAAIDDISGEIARPTTVPLGSVRSKSLRTFAPGDVLFAKITPCMENGKSAVVRDDECDIGFGSTEFHVLRPKEGVDAKFIWHLVRQLRFRRDAAEHMTGSVGQARVPASYLESYPLMLPDLATQRLVSEILDGVTAAKLSSVEHLRVARRALVQFDRTLLASASSGRLTADYRGERVDGNGALPSGWRAAVFGEVCERITVGHVGKMINEYRPSGVPFLRSKNVRELRFDATDIKFISGEFHERLAKSALKPGDIAVVRSGFVGTACVIPTSLPEANCSDLVIARPGPELHSDYAAIYINSPVMKEHVANVAVGSAQAHFNTRSMQAAPVWLPPLAEQILIVDRVAQLRSIAKTIAARIDATVARVEATAEGVAGRALVGEFGRQSGGAKPEVVAAAAG